VSFRGSAPWSTSPVGSVALAIAKASPHVECSVLDLTCCCQRSHRHQCEAHSRWHIREHSVGPMNHCVLSLGFSFEAKRLTTSVACMCISHKFCSRLVLWFVTFIRLVSVMPTV
jgi:hypothetical protein